MVRSWRYRFHSRRKCPGGRRDPVAFDFHKAFRVRKADAGKPRLRKCLAYTPGRRQDMGCPHRMPGRKYPNTSWRRHSPGQIRSLRSWHPIRCRSRMGRIGRWLRSTRHLSIRGWRVLCSNSLQLGYHTLRRNRKDRPPHTPNLQIRLRRRRSPIRLCSRKDRTHRPSRNKAHCRTHHSHGLHSGFRPHSNRLHCSADRN